MKAFDTDQAGAGAMPGTGETLQSEQRLMHDRKNAFKRARRALESLAQFGVANRRAAKTGVTEAPVAETKLQTEQRHMRERNVATRERKKNIQRALRVIAAKRRLALIQDEAAKKSECEAKAKARSKLSPKAQHRLEWRDKLESTAACTDKFGNPIVA